jgi:hypothetical protein
VNQVTVALDSAGNLVAEAGVAVEGVLDGLHGKVGVATIDGLEEGNLRVASKVNILGAVSYELHQTTTCHFISFAEKKNLADLNFSENAE